jgi:putative phosphoribosyl transferase
LHRTLVIHAPKRETSGVMSLFHDRVDAGRPLADLLYAAGLGGDEVVVLGLPRGGVPVAAEVARLLGAPLDVIIVRKLGVPSEPELAMGALGEDGVRVENEGVMGSATLSGSDIGAIVRREEAELVRRARRYRKGRPRLNLQGRRAIIVDDGIATGSTARAACRVARAHGAARVVLAVPVAPKATVLALQDECDDIFSVATPESFSAVGEWYDDFSPTSDAEVVELLRNAQS